MLFSTQKLFCNICGKEMQGFTHDIFSRFTKLRICSKECAKLGETIYTRFIMGIPADACSKCNYKIVNNKAEISTPCNEHSAVMQ